jgi:lipoprotein-anchoring transpeptidase ErfK/SrfK
MFVQIRSTVAAAVVVSGLAACSPQTAPPKPLATVAAKPAATAVIAAPPAVAPITPPAPTIPASTTPVGQAINAAVFAAPVPSTTAPAPAAAPAPAPAPDPVKQRDMLIKVEVMLDRAHVSPGVIDGRDGDNLHRAITAYQTTHHMPGTGALDGALWSALTAADANPAVTDYQISADDVKGPFIGKVPTDMKVMAKLPHMGFTTPLEGLAEKFHMDQALLKALNPGADFGAAGTSIVVAASGSAPLAAPVARIEVDKSTQQVRAFDATGALEAVYPATVGSLERPAPSGVWAVRVVAPRPDYTFDPKRLTFGKSKEVLTIAAGPNNPVGSTWIALTKDTYGIHGTPDPSLVGKRASHGCVRLTNWDAHQLGAAVKKGTVVEFVGVETRAKTAA